MVIGADSIFDREGNREGNQGQTTVFYDGQHVSTTRTDHDPDATRVAGVTS